MEVCVRKLPLDRFVPSNVLKRRGAISFASTDLRSEQSGQRRGPKFEVGWLDHVCVGM